MKALWSFAFGCVFTFMLLMLSSVSQGVASKVIWLLLPGFFLLSWKWPGLDCANADSISDKLNCAGAGLAANVLVYWAIGYVVLSLLARRKQPRESMDRN